MLTGVKHIPSMARNLISLSTLDCDGYKYKGGNKLLKVSSGSLIIMIGDMNSAKLYVLRGTTLPGVVAAVSSDVFKTNLWHKRLGHMSELGIAELAKRELIDGCDLGKSISTRLLNSPSPGRFFVRIYQNGPKIFQSRPQKSPKSSK